MAVGDGFNGYMGRGAKLQKIHGRWCLARSSRFTLSYRVYLGLICIYCRVTINLNFYHQISITNKSTFFYQLPLPKIIGNYHICSMS